MAKKSSIEKNERRRKLTKRYSGRRSRLRATPAPSPRPTSTVLASIVYVASEN